MSSKKRHLLEDRALRDAARKIVTGDVAYLKAGLAEQGVASRVMATGADYVQIMAEGAVDIARDNRGKLSGGLALAATGLAVWIFREEIGDLVSGMVEGLHPDEPDAE